MKKCGAIYLLVLFSSFLYSQNNKEQNQFKIEREANFIADTNWTWRDILNEVVITGQLKEVRAENAVHDIKIITAEIIESGLFSDLSQLLIFDNNIKISNDNILGPALSFQGLSGQNVKILIDGVSVIGRLNGNIDISQVNLNNIERIEIVEGPLSVDLGSDALAGTINIITKKGESRQAFLSTEIGDYTLFNNNLMLALPVGNSFHNLSFSSLESGSSGSYSTNTAFDKTTFFYKYSLKEGKTKTNFSYGYLKRGNQISNN